MSGRTRFADERRERDARFDRLIAEMRADRERIDARMAAIEDRMAGLEGRMDQQAEALRVLTDEMTANTRRVDAQTEELRRMSSRLDGLDGAYLEGRYGHHINWFGEWLRKPRFVGPDDLDGVEAAMDDGRLSDDDVQSLRDADFLVLGRARHGDHDETVLAVEVSPTIDAGDVRRAAEQAELLRRAGSVARGVAGGTLLAAEARDLAERMVALDLRRPVT